MKMETIRSAAIEFGIIERGTERGLTTEERNATLDELDRRGIEHDEYRKYRVEKCPPPHYHPKTLDLDAHREELRTNRYGDFIESDGSVIWNDEAGIGKTTTSGLRALQDERAHALLFTSHEKAWEHVNNKLIFKEVGSNEYFHLKGAKQPLHNCCMETKTSQEERSCCPEHGTESEWPHICPIYDSPKGSNLRQKFELLTHIYSYAEAHRRCCDNDCPWLQQYDGLEDRDRVVGVHQHQTIEALHGHDIIVDESPTTLIEEETYSAQAASRAADNLDSPLKEFVSELANAVSNGDLSRAPLPDEKLTAEALVQHKVRYRELTEASYKLESLTDEPAGFFNGKVISFDAILALLAEEGWNERACREAISGPDALDRCPLCGDLTYVEDGWYRCHSCYWIEGRSSYLSPPGEREPTRAIAYIETTKENRKLEQNRIVYKSLPSVDDLPTSPLILDATATPEKVAGLYGVSPDEVTVEGTETYELNADIIQVMDGQYHAGTIRGNDDGYEEDEQTPSQEQFQEIIDNISTNHEKVLFVLQRRLKQSFEFPESATVRHYGNVRGFNHKDHDAVVCLGAPHPNLTGVKQLARLLTMNNPNIRVGGEEYSTRQENVDPDNTPNPPIYRKLYFEDEEGQGRAVPTKYFSGMVGVLFEEAREKEIVQAAHRVRPISADQSKRIYLITNVPTELPIDQFVELDELKGKPLSSVLPVPEGAISDLLQPLHDALQTDPRDREVPEVFQEWTGERIVATVDELHELVEEVGGDKSSATVRRWANQLVELGLLTKGDYIQREGYSYVAQRSTLSSALRIVSSSIGVKVEETGQLAKLAESADGSLDWLDYAEEAFLKDE